ncbi:MAG: hypothetical protein OJF51_004340 [Nitrospira sp.]|nr:MAG: hypothetical protein OJF51_004340 [Nitrospira sp.]
MDTLVALRLPSHFLLSDVAAASFSRRHIVSKADMNEKASSAQAVEMR